MKPTFHSEIMTILLWKLHEYFVLYQKSRYIYIYGFNLCSKQEHRSFKILNNNSNIFDDLLDDYENIKGIQCLFLDQYILKKFTQLVLQYSILEKLNIIV